MALVELVCGGSYGTWDPPGKMETGLLCVRRERSLEPPTPALWLWPGSSSAGSLLMGFERAAQEELFLII